MSGNTFGKLFTITTFGESHGSCIGGVIDGCPANLTVDYALINKMAKARQTASHPYASKRKETDEVTFVSGISDGITTGTPIAFIIPHTDTQAGNYEANKGILKPSHAHFTYWKKYGIFDERGSGRASARETLARLVGGCFALIYLKQYNIKIHAHTTQIGNVRINCAENIDGKQTSINFLHCPNKTIFLQMLEELEETKRQNDTVGGMVTCTIENVPPGLGEPVFDKLQADLAKAMMGINAAKGFEYGSGFRAAAMKGSAHNDLFKENFHTETNFSGGIQGGISNGETIYFSVAFKPVPSIMQDQESVNIYGEKAIYTAGGRHDICVIPRVLPVVETMAALVIADHLLRFNAYK